MEERIKLAIKFEKEHKDDIIKLLEYFGGKNNICGGFPGDAYCYIDLDGNINAMLSWNSRIMRFDRFDYSEFIKKIQFIPGDKVTVNLPGFEEHSEKEVGELVWNSKSKSIAYSMRCESGEKEIYSPDVLDPVVKEVTVNNIENFQDQEKFEKYYKEITSYECDIFRFDSKISEKDFVIRKDPIEEGHYLTIRLGLQGIYTSVNYWKDNNWMAQVADGSSVIARTREPLKLKYYTKDL